MSESLVLERLSKVYPGGVQALLDVDLTIEQGEFVSLLGPSGCGKTTILNAIAGLDHPTSGRIVLGNDVLSDAGRSSFVPPEKRNLGLVFQSYALWPHMHVLGNLGFALKLRGVGKGEIRRRAAEALELVGLAGMEDRYPFQLSGGQQQRVALARAVVAQPKLLLLDEPLSNLDAKVRESARTWIRDFQQQLGITAVYVTHDQAEALAISDRIAVMSAGRLQQYDTPANVYERPATRFVAEFIGASSFLDATVEVSAQGSAFRLVDGTTITSTAPWAASAGSPVTLAVRSERVRPAGGEGPNRVHATVESVAYLGSLYDYHLRAAAGALRMQCALRIDDPAVWVELPDDAIVPLAVTST